jgi:hypothetical protein
MSLPAALFRFVRWFLSIGVTTVVRFEACISMTTVSLSVYVSKMVVIRELSDSSRFADDEDGDIKDASPRKGGFLAFQAAFSSRAVKEVFFIRSVKLVAYGVTGVCDEALLSAIQREMVESADIERTGFRLEGNVEGIRGESSSQLFGERKAMKLEDGRSHTSARQ